MAFSLVTSTVAQSTDDFNVTTSAINTTGANLLVVILAGFNQAGTETFTDSKGNTWIVGATVNANASRAILYYCINPTVGAGHTFTVTSTGPTPGLFPALSVSAWSNAATPVTFDQGLASTTDDTEIQTGPLSPSKTNVLFITGLTESVSFTATIDSGFTIINQVARNSHARGVAQAYLLQVSADTVLPLWDWSPTLTGASASLVSFLDSSGSPAPDVIVKSAQLPLQVLFSADSTVKSAQLVLQVLRTAGCGDTPPIPPGSGIYKIVPGKRQDTLWNTPPEEIDVKIPDPAAKTALLGD